mgnify:CR=1 FL=1
MIDDRVATATPIQHWRPALAKGFQFGAPRWNGEQLLTDISIAGHRRVLRIGLRERPVIEQINSERTPTEIVQALAAHNVSVDAEAVGGMLNRLLALGIVERPFIQPAQSLAVLDAKAERSASNLSEVWVTERSSGRVSRALGVLSTWPVFVAAGVIALAALIAAAMSAPIALDVLIHSSDGVWLVAAAAIAIVWNLGVTLVHEAAHVGVFRALSGRDARLSITRLGIVPMLNTQLDGLGLMPWSGKVRVVMSGPLVSLISLGIPWMVFTLVPAGTFWQIVAAAALILDLVVAGLAISFFPNTDGTRFLEALASVDQLQSVAFRTLIRAITLPKALPTSTRFIVRIYPLLLMATVCTVLLLGVLAFGLVLR